MAKAIELFAIIESVITRVFRIRTALVYGRGKDILRLTHKRWWQPALLLFVMLLGSACSKGQETADGPTAVPATLVAEEEPMATQVIEPSATPLPLVSFKGVEFIFDEKLLGAIGDKFHLPPAPPGALPAQPERLVIELSDDAGDELPQLTIFPVEQYEALSDEAAEDIASLQELLKTRPTDNLTDLPLVPFYQAVESYHSRPTYLDFQNGSGISFLARADHDHSLATDEAFFYTFQGLTNDGQFYVAAFVPLSGSVNNGSASHQTQDGSTEHSAKPALGGGWISADAGEGYSLVDDIMLSLLVTPDDSFPSIILPSFAASDGISVAYDSAISGEASVQRVPAIVKNPEGITEFLHGLPDILAVDFNQNADDSEAMLQVQQIRDESGTFFESIPQWQQQFAEALAGGTADTITKLHGEESISDLVDISFQNGHGYRWLSQDTLNGDRAAQASSSPQTYHFHGVSSDGRTLVRAHHPIEQDISQLEALAYLDSVINSLMIDPGASLESSIPINAEDCENNAEFLNDVSIPADTEVERGDVFVKIWRIRNSGTCTWTPAYHIRYVEGNPIDWQEMAIGSVVAPGEETEVSITANSPFNPGIYQAWWQIADEQEQPFGESLLLRFEAPRPATDIPGYGVIEGDIKYPANGNPAVDVYFLRTDGSERYVMQTEKGWTLYSNSVPVGDYFVFARVVGDSSDSGGGYTNAVICGLHADCQDHDLVEVAVREGRAARDVDIFDWYAPAGSFPLPDAEPQPQG